MSTESSSVYQSQVQATELATQVLNLQETMKGVVRTLERLERVAEGVDRHGAISRHDIGDENHQDISTNLEALNARLGCLQGILGAYQNDSYRSQCINHLNKWYQMRQGRYSPVLAQAAFDSISACIGEFKMKTMDVRLNEAELLECAGRLYEACSRYHDKADKVSADPLGYLSSDHCMKVFTDGRMQDTDWTDLLNAMRQEHQTQEDAGDNFPGEYIEGEHQIPDQSKFRRVDGSDQSGSRDIRQWGNAASGDSTSTQPIQADVNEGETSSSNAQSASVQLDGFLIDWMAWLTEQLDENGHGDQFQKVKHKCDRFRVYLDAHSNEGERWAKGLSRLYLKAKATFSENALLCVAFSIVTFLDKTPGSFNSAHLQWMLYYYLSAHKDQRSISEICSYFILELQKSSYP